jgi:hypothetical protein
MCETCNPLGLTQPAPSQARNGLRGDRQGRRRAGDPRPLALSGISPFGARSATSSRSRPAGRHLAVTQGRVRRVDDLPDPTPPRPGSDPMPLSSSARIGQAGRSRSRRRSGPQQHGPPARGRVHRRTGSDPTIGDAVGPCRMHGGIGESERRAGVRDRPRRPGGRAAPGPARSGQIGPPQERQGRRDRVDHLSGAHHRGDRRTFPGDGILASQFAASDNGRIWVVVRSTGRSATPGSPVLRGHRPRGGQLPSVGVVHDPVGQGRSRRADGPALDGRPIVSARTGCRTS